MSVQPARDYPRLFAAMNEVLRALMEGGDEAEALGRSFEAAADGFAAEKALLLVVEAQSPLRLRGACVRGLSSRQIEACERGESVAGVSSSLIRAVMETRALKLRQPILPQSEEETPALIGPSYSVLCCPVVDPVRDVLLAVMYFQNSAVDPRLAYGEADGIWLQGYAAALGRAFALHFARRAREREMAELIEGRACADDAPELIGDSPETRTLRARLHRIYIPAAEAPDPDPVLILGEKGTGKDLVARYLHAYSGRWRQPFVAVNCAEITDELAAARFFGHRRGAFTGAVADEPGLFRAAHRGLLFLDEIAELSPRAQATLLRVLENRTVVPVGETREVRVDVQVVLATNRDPEQAVAAGVIKDDLYERFKVQAIELTPLRDRPWDVPALAQHFLAHHERRTRKRTLGLTRGAMRALLSYAWPGNVRELARVCSLLVTHTPAGARIDEGLLGQCFPAVLRADPRPAAARVDSAGLSMRKALRAFERELILSRLEQHGWDLRAARESLKVPKTTFRRYLVELGIKPGARDRRREPEPEAAGG